MSEWPRSSRGSSAADGAGSGRESPAPSPPCPFLFRRAAGRWRAWARPVRLARAPAGWRRFPRQPGATFSAPSRRGEVPRSPAPARSRNRRISSSAFCSASWLARRANAWLIDAGDQAQTFDDGGRPLLLPRHRTQRQGAQLGFTVVRLAPEAPRRRIGIRGDETLRDRDRADRPPSRSSRIRPPSGWRPRTGSTQSETARAASTKAEPNAEGAGRSPRLNASATASRNRAAAPLRFDEGRRRSRRRRASGSIAAEPDSHVGDEPLEAQVRVRRRRQAGLEVEPLREVDNRRDHVGVSCRRQTR